MKALVKSLFVPVFALLLSGCSRATVYPNSEKYLAGNQEYAGELTTLNVHYDSGEVTLVEDPSVSVISIVEQGTFDKPYQVHSYYVENTLNVQFMQSGVSYNSSRMAEKRLTITYPKVSSLSIHVTSGAIVGQNLNAFDANISVTSGKVNINSITATNLNIAVTSGNIDIGQVVSTSLNVGMTSGQTLIGSLTSSKANFEATSGSVLLNVAYMDEMNISLTSGRIDLTVPPCGASLKVEKTSGSFTSNQPYMVVDNRYNYGEAHAVMNLKITSGSILIR